MASKVNHAYRNKSTYLSCLINSTLSSLFPLTRFSICVCFSRTSSTYWRKFAFAQTYSIEEKCDLYTKKGIFVKLRNIFAFMRFPAIEMQSYLASILCIESLLQWIKVLLHMTARWRDATGVSNSSAYFFRRNDMIAVTIHAITRYAQHNN